MSEKVDGVAASNALSALVQFFAMPVLAVLVSAGVGFMAGAGWGFLTCAAFVAGAVAWFSWCMAHVRRREAAGEEVPHGEE